MLAGEAFVVLSLALAPALVVLEILSYIFWVVLALTLLVFVHEMGHFLAAKLFGMRVDRFSIGFPPVIFGKQYGETEYVVGATPLGGYVKIAGMIDESMDTEHVGSAPEPHEFRAKPVWQRIIVITAGVVFNVILAALIFTGLNMSYGETYVPADAVGAVYVQEGSLAHELGLRTGDRITAINDEPPREASQLMLGNPDDFLADSLTITVERQSEKRTFIAPPNIVTRLTRAAREGERFGVSFQPAIVSSVRENMPAAEAGLQPGDRITAIGGEPVRFWMELSEKIKAAEGRPLTLRWRRPDSALTDGSRAEGASPERATRRAVSSDSQRVRRGGVFEAQVTPRYDSTAGRYLVGIGSPTRAMMQERLGKRTVSYGPGEALAAGVGETWTTTENIAESFQRIFFGRDSFRANVGGPVEIARVAKQTADAGGYAFWSFVALLSVTLAIMNILPIPALDGGHLVFLVYEGITRRRPSEKVRMVMQQIGFVVLIVFMAFVIFNDILRL